ncbi:hypothetical protein SAMN05421690_10268 [Nitrosomonas sp. Nm51]|uniref:hypothetical protein n=1 Tax=Nitrosomonas sp. Nm51 TaxID=133720 RepID=UPI0008B26415|nr:hypothetical protein [Nitrosomonas sp. Nm51]SER42634.1 hypothetical protein SAMN05421690_10268 [Nitrosomonas sp. Nm51]
MIIRTVLLLLPLFLTTGPVSAMQLEADPRIIISFMDKSLPPELDILRVTADVSENNRLIFQVQTKGERASGEDSDYVMLHIQHEKAYALIIPLNRGADETVRVYEAALQPENQLIAITFKESRINREHAGFSVRRIDRGTEFTMPLGWINFGEDFGFDAYTIDASIQEDTLQINEIYDQARRGRAQVKQVSAITLLNNICSPKK